MSANSHPLRRVQNHTRKCGVWGTQRLLADFIIGSHALAHADRFMTLDPQRYARDFPELKPI